MKPLGMSYQQQHCHAMDLLKQLVTWYKIHHTGRATNWENQNKKTSGLTGLIEVGDFKSVKSAKKRLFKNRTYPSKIFYFNSSKCHAVP